MKPIKCKLIEYRKSYYLLYDDGRTAKVGDKVLTSSTIALQRVDALSREYGKEGMGFLSGSGNVPHLLSQLPVVAATGDKINKKDIDILKENPLCYIFENEGEAIKSDGDIVISFIEINYAEFKAKN